MSYRCLTCGERHDDLPDLSLDKPDYWWDVPEEERESRIVLIGSDACIIDDKDFFIRGVIEIPIHDYPERFGFGVWVSQKRENFFTYLDNFDSAEIGPFFGWLSTEINYFAESTLSLKTMAHFRGGKQRPRIEVEPTDHALAIAQRNGITLDKAWEIVHFYKDAGRDTS
ncbi:MAG TPA: DUF2199 domain-containing protein [Pyrinomonadaceae bacterium]|nr:DUF2199 domain-containing protein [Pyrinomonadaceae bacterium]